MRIALGLEYDGSHFWGWQTQPQGRTVQDVLQRALSQIGNHSISVVAAGRTDTGVHAMEQVVHFDTEAERPLTAWVRGVNALLPPTVTVNWAHPVSPQFHARFSARGRSYRYVLINRPTRSALYAGKMGWFHSPLSLERMQQAAACLLGKHDFSSFRASECQAKSPVKTLYKLEVSQSGELLVFDLQADAFLHHMVRNIVGCLVYVGKEKYPVEWMQELLIQRSRKLAAPTFAPDGLYFKHVSYEPKWQLPQRALEWSLPVVG